MKWEAVVVGVCAVAGCGETRGESAFETANGDSSPLSATGDDDGQNADGGGTVDGADDGQSDADSDDSGAADDAIFDVGTDKDLPGTNNCGPDEEDCGCNAVDLLFVVDNSGSMDTHRAPIIAAFPTFVEEMVSVLPAGTDLHVGLTRATGFYNPGNAGGWSGPGCEASVTDGVFYPPEDGNNGENGQQGRLFEHDGLRYFAVQTGQNTAELTSWFDGAMTGVIDGLAPHSNTETVVAGAAYPFHPANADYNAGFVRQNAVLVLFLLSDSPDLTPASVPTSDFVDMVVDAKAGCGDHCIVTSGAIAGACYNQAGNTNTRLTDFLDGFANPPASWVDLGFNSPDFSGVLGGALAEVVAATCDEIPPEG